MQKIFQKSLSKIGELRTLRSISDSPSVTSCDVWASKLLPEEDSLHVQFHKIADYSFPQELLSFVPSPGATVAFFRNGDKERKIHCNVELSPDELQKLDALSALASTRQIQFSPFVRTAATRYIARNRGDVKKALQDMTATQEWRLAYFGGGPITDAAIVEDCSHGIVYFCGRDRFLRPALVVRPHTIPMAWYKDKRGAAERIKRLLVFHLEYMLGYMLFPGRLEGGVVLLDLQKLSLGQVPLMYLKEILTIMSSHYVNRVFCFYVLHMQPALSAAATMGLRLLSERQRQKLHFVTRPEELQQ